MIQPKASHPHWPDAAQDTPKDSSALKPWSWALERLEKSHNYWISTTRPGGRPHLMLVWGIWWQDAFWFSTGPRTRKAKNIAADPHVVIGTEKADEAVILEGTAEEIEDRTMWKQLVEIYNRNTAAMWVRFSNLPEAVSFASKRKWPSARTSTPRISPIPSPAGNSKE